MITENREHRHSDWVDQVPRDPESGEILNWVDGDVIPGAFYYESFMAKKPTIEGSFNDPPHVNPQDGDVVPGGHAGGAQHRAIPAQHDDQV